jgi:hypothetical protein
VLEFLREAETAEAPNRFGVVGDELNDEAWRLLDQHPLCA